ncbi:hypothetical protein JTE90_018965 [Oedothorax gibbosus]|uniref:G-protein coupled receptors family 1 profile domain-containing protein n=1 Tax=Oedothorax gibbosus TaxID=931172 RepID=A0AAV6V1E5_9ARAC|nr:hypothetical protein JTE90_018965 [Oedothorax gibbosus]
MEHDLQILDNVSHNNKEDNLNKISFYDARFSEENFTASLNDDISISNSSTHYILHENTEDNLVFPRYQSLSLENRTIRSNKIEPPSSTISANLIGSKVIGDLVIPFGHPIEPETTTNPDNNTPDYFESLSNDSTCWNDTLCTNCSHGLQHAPTFNAQTLIKCVVLLCLGSTAVIGNVATLTSIFRRGRQNTSTVYLLLVHLSVADLMVTWFCIIGEGVWMLAVQWYAGNVLCKIFKFLQMLSLYQSTFILVVIGFDRLCAVKFPMRRVKARTQVQKFVLLAWLLSCALSAPQVSGFIRFCY